MKKILFVFGTRPELIKLVPLMKLMDTSADFEYINISTGQHKEMLQPIIRDFSLFIDYDLSIMKKNQSVTEITASILEKIEVILKNENPDIVFVHGDTTTAFAAALAAYYQQIPVAHIEAGLRSKNIYSPFPEEMNRVLIDHISSIHFAPTIKNQMNLLKENINPNNIFITGNTVIDMFKYTLKTNVNNQIFNKFPQKKIILLTMHRRENIGESMKSAFLAVNRLLENLKDIAVVFPIHFNPIVRELAKQYLKPSKRLLIIEPLDIIEFHNLLNKSYLIMTDSGGIQEEAPFIGIPTIVLRNETERPEAVATGINQLVGTNENNIYNAVFELVTNKELYSSISQKQSLYGDGNACERIEFGLQEYFGINNVHKLMTSSKKEA